MASKVVRNASILCLTQVLIFLTLFLLYTRRHSNIMIDENLIMSALRDTVTSVGHKLTDCRLLFGNETSAHGFSMTEEFRSNIAEFLSTVNAKHAAHEDGNTYMVDSQYKLFHYLTWKLKFVHTVCETGFNAGHSSFSFLTARPDLIVHSFDIGHHGYVRPMAKYLQKKFPGRLSITLGDSRKTIPRYFVGESWTCDLIYVDGGHRLDVPLKDILNFARVASQPHNVILVDDVDAPDVKMAWELAIKSGIVQQRLLSECWYGKKHKIFAVGVVVQQNKRSKE